MGHNFESSRAIEFNTKTLSQQFLVWSSSLLDDTITPLSNFDAFTSLFQLQGRALAQPRPGAASCWRPLCLLRAAKQNRVGKRIPSILLVRLSILSRRLFDFCLRLRW